MSEDCEPNLCAKCADTRRLVKEHAHCATRQRNQQEVIGKLEAAVKLLNKMLYDDKKHRMFLQERLDTAEQALYLRTCLAELQQPPSKLHKSKSDRRNLGSIREHPADSDGAMAHVLPSLKNLYSGNNKAENSHKDAPPAKMNLPLAKPPSHQPHSDIHICQNPTNSDTSWVHSKQSPEKPLNGEKSKKRSRSSPSLKLPLPTGNNEQNSSPPAGPTDTEDDEDDDDDGSTLDTDDLSSGSTGSSGTTRLSQQKPPLCFVRQPSGVQEKTSKVKQIHRKLVEESGDAKSVTAGSDDGVESRNASADDSKSCNKKKVSASRKSTMNESDSHCQPIVPPDPAKIAKILKAAQTSGYKAWKRRQTNQLLAVPASPRKSRRSTKLLGVTVSDTQARKLRSPCRVKSDSKRSNCAEDDEIAGGRRPFPIARTTKSMLLKTSFTKLKYENPEQQWVSRAGPARG